MSGWLGCCECLQRRAMSPARRHSAARPAGPPPQPQPHGHHNAAFLGDEEVATSPRQQQQQQLDENTDPERIRSTQPAVEQRGAPAQPRIRPQPREICDLRDDRPRRTSIWKVLSGRPQSPQRPRSPATRSREARGSLAGPGRQAPAVQTGPFESFAMDAEWPADEPPTVLQRRVSQLDNIPETSETTETNETSETALTAEPAAETAAAGPADGGGSSRPTDGSEPASDLPVERLENAADPGSGDIQPADPDGPAGAAEENGRPGSTVRARASSLGTPRRLSFPRLRRRSPQERRQSAEGAGSGREPSRERSWLRRLSRGRPSGALKADQPPEQPELEPEQVPNLALRRWGIVRSNFDLDAPLTDHWSFLESVTNNFAKIDAKTYTEHLHEQSPPSSSCSEEEVPDALEAQLLLKLAQSEMIQPRKSAVSRRCVKMERQRRRMERQRSSSESAEPVDHVPVEPVKMVAEEPRLELSGPAVEMSGSGQSSPAPRASSCPPPQRVVTPVPSADHRQRRSSILDRLLALQTSQPRRPSLPPAPSATTAAAPAAAADAAESPSPDSLTVHHPTWFQRADGPEAAVGPAPDQQALHQRRATVVEVSLQEFLEEVDERTQHLKEEEFCGADPYQVLAPEQRAADDDHVVPLLDAPRCVGLMLADAEKRLELEYSNPPSPSPRLSPCPTPRRSEGTERDGGARNGEARGRGGSTEDRGTQDDTGDSPLDKEPADDPGAGSTEKAECCPIGSHTADNAKCGAKGRQTAEGSQVSAFGEETSYGPDGGPSHGRRVESPRPYCAAEDSSQTTAERPPCCEKTTTAASDSQSRAQAAISAGSVMLSRLPAYLTNIQHEMAAATESLKTKLQSTLSSHDAEPSKSAGTSKSPLKSDMQRKFSQSFDAALSTTVLGTEQSCKKATKSIPSTTPTPRNSLAHPSQQSSPADPRPAPSAPLPGTSATSRPVCPATQSLLGYQQLAMAMARQSTVGYQELALALTQQQGTTAAAAAAAEGPEAGPASCQAVQTSPGLASPAGPQCKPAGGQSCSAQTSSGTSSPAERGTGCDKCGVCQGVCTCTQADSCAQNTSSSVQNAPCTQSDSCSQRAPPEEVPGAESPVSPGGCGSRVWTIPTSDHPPSACPAPPARLLAYGQPSWVSRQQSSPEQAAELRRRLDGGQRAAGRRRDAELRRRAERAAEMAAPAAYRSGGDHDRADLPPRPNWR